MRAGGLEERKGAWSVENEKDMGRGGGGGGSWSGQKKGTVKGEVWGRERGGVTAFNPNGGQPFYIGGFVDTKAR